MATTSAASKRTARRALDRRLPALSSLAAQTATPRGGWVRAIREALGMSAADLAARMGVVESTVLRLEQNEQARRIQVDTLERAANALGCDLVYALVPREPLEDRVQQQALARARDWFSLTRHSMALEDQAASSDVDEQQLQEQAAIIRDQPGLWREHDGA
ncbi:MAG TPA: mobile mystery protein A [Candidatus Nanopelagicales bacterium]